MNRPPKVSYILIGYQHGPFVRAAALSAIAQDYPDIEFVFSDDSSTDETYAVMQEVAGAGLKAGRNVVAIRTPSNLGLSRHLAYVFEQANGDIFVLQSADDIARPNRVSELVKIFVSEPRAQMVMSNVSVIDSSGTTIRPKYAPAGIRYVEDVTTLVRNNFPWLVGASEAIRREVFTQFGPAFFASCWEDYVFAFRAALTGRIFFCDKVLLSWRHHYGNMSHFRDFSGSRESRETFRKHFLRNIRARIIYSKQQLIDFSTVKLSLPSENRQELQCLLEERIFNARLELAARSGASWKLMAILLQERLLAKSSIGWLLRQVAIRMAGGLYFWLLYRQIQTRLQKEHLRASSSDGADKAPILSP